LLRRRVKIIKAAKEITKTPATIKNSSLRRTTLNSSGLEGGVGLTVGDTLGPTDGCCVGLTFVREVMGIELGVVVMLMELVCTVSEGGKVDGYIVGLLVRNVDGYFVCLAVGFIVGEFVGTMDGPRLGRELVGANVGDIDGTVDGA